MREGTRAREVSKRMRIRKDTNQSYVSNKQINIGRHTYILLCAAYLPMSRSANVALIHACEGANCVAKTAARMPKVLVMAVCICYCVEKTRRQLR